MALCTYGFVDAGAWKTRLTVKSLIAPEFSSPLRSERVVYAFVANDEVKYIGVCDKPTTTLEERMRRYQYEQGGTTNRRVANEIGALLEAGTPVKIFALKPKRAVAYEDLAVDLVKGLENSQEAEI